MPRKTESKTLERLALGYLDRFDSSVENLRRVLVRHVNRARERGEAADGAEQAIESLLSRYQENGLLDDARCAANWTTNLRARGNSAALIAQKLQRKGFSPEVIQAALLGGEHSELDAARALVRRRRLGCYRPAEERARHREKDLTVLARAGFELDTATAALGLE
ncbi:MAG TPA: RecX family transcriptional regulator [Polyangiaceae bacterium]